MPTRRIGSMAGANYPELEFPGETVIWRYMTLDSVREVVIVALRQPIQRATAASWTATFTREAVPTRGVGSLDQTTSSGSYRRDREQATQ